MQHQQRRPPRRSEKCGTWLSVRDGDPVLWDQPLSEGLVVEPELLGFKTERDERGNALSVLPIDFARSGIGALVSLQHLHFVCGRSARVLARDDQSDIADHEAIKELPSLLR